MPDSGNTSMIRLVLVSGTVVLIDQITKALISHYLPLNAQVKVIDGWFNITHVLNPGGAFGLFSDQPLWIRKIVFLFLSSLVALSVLWFYKRTAGSLIVLSYGLALIFGGAVGNLIDRFRYGKVLDFLDFYMGTAHWPAFNVADSAISIGMVILIYHVVLNKIPEF